MIKRVLYLFLILEILITLPASAEMISREYNGTIYVEETTVKELENLFTKHHYLRFRALPNNEYPAIFVKKLPSDFNKIEQQKYRNELFIRILAPLALKINEEIANERASLLRLERSFKQSNALSEDEIKHLESLASKYDYFTRLKDNERIADQIDQLKIRINVVPPSILIAASAMETNWGFSRIAQQANSLYKEKVWYTNEGLEPLENKEEGYRFKIFKSLIESMRSFALTFNSNIAYFNVWGARKAAIDRQENLIGESIAYSLSVASNLPNFVGILDYTTAFYDLVQIDNGKLKRIHQ